MAQNSQPNIPTEFAPPLEPAASAVGEHRRSFAMLRVLAALILREMTARFGTPFGFIWALIEPVAQIAVLSAGFALLMRAPSLGTSFIVFYASGVLVFKTFRDTEKMVTKSLSYSRQLLVFPSVTWVDAILARFLFNFMMSVFTTYLILAGVLWITGTRTILDMVPMVQAMLLAGLLGLGLGSLNCFLFGMFPIWQTTWKVVTRPLMLASAVLYIVEDLPSAAQNIMWWNPLAHLTGLMRTGIFPTYQPQYISLPYVAGWALIPLAIGLFFLRIYHKDVIHKK